MTRLDSVAFHWSTTCAGEGQSTDLPLQQLVHICEYMVRFHVKHVFNTKHWWTRGKFWSSSSASTSSMSLAWNIQFCRTETLMLDGQITVLREKSRTQIRVSAWVSCKCLNNIELITWQLL